MKKLSLFIISLLSLAGHFLYAADTAYPVYSDKNIKLSDSPGIIHTTTKELSKYNMDIIELNSDCIHGAQSCTPLFNLNIKLDIKSDLLIPEIKKNLEEILYKNYGAETNITIE